LAFGDSLPMSDVTHILAGIERGDPRADEKLLPLVCSLIELYGA
jgi:hypothetical protein